MEKLPPEFVGEFQKVLGQRHPKTNEHLDKLLESLDKHKLLYTIEKVNPKFFITHKGNRGGLLLSPHNVHRNAARIHRCGADLKQLSNALCIELGTDSTLRWEHIARNKKLIGRADGLLAKINGSERYVTVGCGHTAAFCKHAALQGNTSQPTLKCNGSDKIDLQRICEDTKFKIMIEEGWTWKVVPAIIDEVFPKL